VVNPPDSLTDPALDEVWDRVRDRLERSGSTNRGRVRLPALSAPARLALSAVVDRPAGATVDLRALERGLIRLGLGADLPEALATLGRPVSPEPARRRAERQEAASARTAARAAAAAWPEPWSRDWIDEVIRSGALRNLSADEAVALVAASRMVLDRLAGDAGPTAHVPVSRGELAAKLFGSAHALDTGTRLEAATTRALAHRHGGAEPRDLWARAGAHLDLTSGPVLTWRLPVTSACRLRDLFEAADMRHVPLHLTQLALRQHPIDVPPGTPVLVTENPRVLEAAAEMRASRAVTSGHPSLACQLLLDQLQAAGAELRYHGDFDAEGLDMCAAMHRRGLTPWSMDAGSYLDALQTAAADGVELPREPNPAPPTPWDPTLQTVFDEHRRIVHEERLLPELVFADERPSQG
jgi:uncharacterized protein (TIGR02679 family)